MEESQEPSKLGGQRHSYMTKLAEACQSLLKKWVTRILSNELAIWVSHRAYEPKILSGQHLQRPKWPPASSDDWRSNTCWEGALWSLEVLYSEFLVGKPLFKTKTYQRTFGSISKNNFTCPDFVIEGVGNLTSRQWRQNPCRRRSLEEGTCTLWIKAESSHRPSLPLTHPLMKKKKAKKQPVHNLKTLYLKEVSLGQAAT